MNAKITRHGVTDTESSNACWWPRHLYLRKYSPRAQAQAQTNELNIIIKKMFKEMFPEQSCEHGNNPKTAGREYLNPYLRFDIDSNIYSKLLIAVERDGYLKRVR